MNGNPLPLVAPLYPAGREPLPPGITEENREQFLQAKKYQSWMTTGMESCVAKTVMAGVGGLGIGAFFSLMSASFAYEDPYLRQQTQAGMSNTQKAREVFKEMGRGMWRTGKGFGKVGALFAGIECVIEAAILTPVQYRAKNDIVNPVAAGFVAGGILARHSGPRAALGVMTRRCRAFLCNTLEAQSRGMLWRRLAGRGRKPSPGVTQEQIRQPFCPTGMEVLYLMHASVGRLEPDEPLIKHRGSVTTDQRLVLNKPDVKMGSNINQGVNIIMDWIRSLMHCHFTAMNLWILPPEKNGTGPKLYPSPTPVSGSGSVVACGDWLIEESTYPAWIAYAKEAQLWKRTGRLIERRYFLRNMALKYLIEHEDEPAPQTST
ncbi:Tim17/Tim22/Tim23/Pmp24 family-domain-containing protein [Scleroderma yunnanense]